MRNAVPAGVSRVCLAVAAAALLTACETLDEVVDYIDPGFLWSDGEESRTETAGEGPAAAEAGAAGDVEQRAGEAMAEADREGIPNLAAVPERPPAAATGVREQVLAGLEADRDRARYTAGAALLPGDGPESPAASPAISRATAPAESRAASPAGSRAAGASGGFAGTAAGTAAAAAPAPAGEAVVVSPGAADGAAVSPMLLARIFFPHDSDALDRDDADVVRQVAEVHRRHGGRLRVVGHASGRTAQLSLEQHARVNVAIAMRRAEAVAGELVRLGVAPAAIMQEGAGAGFPVYRESMPTGEAGNRRVEIYLTR